MSIPYGPHLTGDLRHCDPALMSDGAYLYRFLKDLVGEIGLNPIGAPHLDLYDGPHHEWDGFSATVHIQTSHITMHAFAFGYVFIDIFSCKPFGVERAKDFTMAALGCQAPDAQWALYERGKNFPHTLIDPEQRALYESGDSC